MTARALLLLGAVGCSANAAERTPLVVFAASSLTEAFHDLEAGFEARHPDVDVQVTFAGSQVLRLQVEHGARADVFASANPAHVQALDEAGFVVGQAPLAGNGLAVVVPVDNPARIRTFADLDQASRIVVGSSEAPVGRYTERVLDRARAVFGEEFGQHVDDAIVSREPNVRLVRAKVELGEADAAFVYRTDAITSDQVHLIEVPDAIDVRARYDLAVLQSVPQAKDFAAYVGSPEGRQTLTRRGFEAPGP